MYVLYAIKKKIGLVILAIQNIPSRQDYINTFKHNVIKRMKKKNENPSYFYLISLARAE